MHNDNEKGAAILTKLLLVAGAVVFVLIVIAIAKEVYRKKQIQSEINKLQQQAEEINRTNLEIKDKISYLESRDYQEKEAKDKLNLQEEGEKVVIIKPSAVKLPENKTVEQPIRAADVQELANPKKWWNYFFKY